MTVIMTMLMMVMIWQVRMRRINPLHSFRTLNRFQIRQVHCYSVTITPVFSVSNRPSTLQTEQRRGRMKRISKQHPSSSFQFPRTKQTPPLLPVPLKQQQTKPKEKSLHSPHQNTLQLLFTQRINLLMRHIRRHENKIPRSRLSRKFQPLSPPHPRLPFKYINNAFEMTMVMCAGFGVRVDGYGSCPELLGTYSGEVDGCCAGHAWGFVSGVRM
jgi:hypothetical protein